MSSSIKPNILVINSARKWIGEAAHCITLVQGLRKRGLSVFLACRKDYVLEEIARQQKIPHYALYMKGKFTGIFDLLDLLKLRSIILKHNIHVVHCHRGKDHWLAAAILRFIGRKRRPVLIRTRHVVMPVKNHIFNRWLYKYWTDDVIAVSEKAAESLKGLPLHCPPRIIFASVDSVNFSPEKRSGKFRKELGVPEEASISPLIGLVGRLQRIKGQGVFLKAAAAVLMKFPEARFLLAGKGSERKREQIRRMAREYGVEGNLILLDYVDNIETLVASLDVGVVASIGSEGSSRIVMEYMASGTPVVATRVGGIPELLDEGRYGHLVRPKDPSELSRAIIQVLSERDQTASGTAAMMNAALDYARTHLTPDRFLDETLRVYDLS